MRTKYLSDGSGATELRKENGDLWVLSSTVNVIQSYYYSEVSGRNCCRVNRVNLLLVLTTFNVRHWDCVTPLLFVLTSLLIRLVTTPSAGRTTFMTRISMNKLEVFRLNYCQVYQYSVFLLLQNDLHKTIPRHEEVPPRED